MSAGTMNVNTMDMMASWTLLADRGDTATVGAWLGSRLLTRESVPRVLTARGDLGAGKTSLAQGLARGLGVPADVYVNSPTFALHQAHEGAVTFHHLDLYRLMDEDELLHLGFEELLERGVSYIEWPQRAPHLIRATPHLNLELLYLDELPSSIADQLSEAQRASEGRVLIISGRAEHLEALFEVSGELSSDERWSPLASHADLTQTSSHEA